LFPFCRLCIVYFEIPKYVIIIFNITANKVDLPIDSNIPVPRRAARTLAPMPGVSDRVVEIDSRRCVHTIRIILHINDYSGMKV
ncbi:hypothetical protein PENTCL1PPCAC_22254, partial [Pristionchus entomophagus]